MASVTFAFPHDVIVSELATREFRFIPAKGEPGYTPQKGVDYWTAADIAEIDEHVVADVASRFSVSGTTLIIDTSTT